MLLQCICPWEVRISQCNPNHGLRSVGDSPWFHNLTQELFPILDFWDTEIPLIFLVFLSEWSNEIYRRWKSPSILVIEDHGGFCFQDKHYIILQEKKYCCGKAVNIFQGRGVRSHAKTCILASLRLIIKMSRYVYFIKLE